MYRVGSQVAMRLTLALFVSSLAAQAWAEAISRTDKPHSKDSPIVSRFAGSTIVGYHESDYDEVALPMGPLSHSELGKTLPTSGKVTRIAYASPAGKTPVEVFANFRNSLERSGFRILYSCTADGTPSSCGGYEFAHKYSEQLFAHDGAGRNVMIDLLWSASGDVRYLTAELQRGDRKVDVGLMVSQNGQNPAGVLLQVIEAGQMPTEQVTVDAAAMSRGLQNEGKIALYGLQFDLDSANLRPDSDATLKQMSDLLHQQPKLKVYIVGHTDSSGSLEHNVALSQRRAESVIKALTSRFGVAADRLSAKGLASYSPVASNREDAGKTKNRRVEMVEQ